MMAAHEPTVRTMLRAGSESLPGHVVLVQDQAELARTGKDLRHIGIRHQSVAHDDVEHAAAECPGR